MMLNGDSKILLNIAGILVHPANSADNKVSYVNELRRLINEVFELYHFAVSEVIALENNLNVLYKTLRYQHF